MIYVIGSGPAGVAASKALLKRGLTVTMLDVGIELETQKQKQLKSLKKKWDANIIEAFKSSLTSKNELNKASYGSNYPYDGTHEHINFIIDNRVHCQPSFAKGGLSNVWGAFSLPYLAAEIDSWPISPKCLEPYYQGVLCFMPLAQSTSECNSIYPLYTEHPLSYKLSKQAQYLFSHYQKNQKSLHENNFQYGTARLSVEYTDQNGKEKCVYCGLCQYGCPYELIYSSKKTLVELEGNDHFSYNSGVVVEYIEEKQAGIIIFAHDYTTREKKTFYASQVFFACGAVCTAQILLSSLKKYDKKIIIADSQHFMFPAFLYKRFRNVKKEKLHTLCQLYIDINNQNLSLHPIRLQIYTYMEHFESEFKTKFGKIYPFIKFLLTPFLERMIVVQGFLHSNESPAFCVQVKENKSTEINLIENKRTFCIIKKTMKFLFKKRAVLGFIPIIFLLKITKVARSYHYGASFPMRKEPKEFETDIWGRLSFYKRVNIVDSSIFPDIPAQSITFSVMANAMRIASECKIHE